jgi:hypothetical protein
MECFVANFNFFVSILIYQNLITILMILVLILNNFVLNLL